MEMPARLGDLVADAVSAFGLAEPMGWSDLGGSWTTNLRLDFPGQTPLVLRIHDRRTTPARLLALQAARDAVADAGIPAIRHLSALDGSSYVQLDDQRVAELEPYLEWSQRMNTVSLLTKGFGILGRVHDALRDAPIPAAGRTADHANHIHSAEAAEATRRGADRIQGWNDLVLSRFADRVVRQIDAVDAAEAPLRDRQVRQVVHGDFWDNNVLFHDHELVALIDFDFMAERPRIDDLALTIYFYLLEADGDLPTVRERDRVRGFVDAYDAATSLKLSFDERAALPLAIARQPAWSVGHWVNVLDEPQARAHAAEVVGELPVAQAVLAELDAWQDALINGLS